MSSVFVIGSCQKCSQLLFLFLTCNGLGKATLETVDMLAGGCFSSVLVKLIIRLWKAILNYTCVLLIFSTLLFHNPADPINSTYKGPR